MDIKSMNFTAEANKSASNTENFKEGLISPLADNTRETGFAPLAAFPEASAQKEFLLIEIQEKSRAEEYRKINILLNKEANFVKFLKEISEGNKTFFAFEKPNNFLLGFLNTEFASLSESILISLFKQSIEIILKLKEIANEKFDFFNAHLFSVELQEKGFQQGYPILKILYNGEIKSYNPSNNLFSSNEFFWLFYLFNLIFKDYSVLYLLHERNLSILINFDASIKQEMNQVNEYLVEKINRFPIGGEAPVKTGLQSLYEFIDIFNKVLEKKKITKIAYNINIKYHNQPGSLSISNINTKNIRSELAFNPSYGSALGLLPDRGIINPCNENQSLNNINPKFEYFTKKNNLIGNCFIENNNFNNFDKEKSFIENTKNLINKQQQPNDLLDNSEKTQINSTININGNYNNININSDKIFNNSSHKNKNSGNETLSLLNNLPFNMALPSNNSDNITNNFALSESKILNNFPIVNTAAINNLNANSNPGQDFGAKFYPNSANLNSSKINFFNNHNNYKNQDNLNNFCSSNNNNNNNNNNHSLNLSNSHLFNNCNSNNNSNAIARNLSEGNNELYSINPNSSYNGFYNNTHHLMPNFNKNNYNEFPKDNFDSINFNPNNYIENKSKNLLQKNLIPNNEHQNAMTFYNNSAVANQFNSSPNYESPRNINNNDNSINKRNIIDPISEKSSKNFNYFNNKNKQINDVNFGKDFIGQINPNNINNIFNNASRTPNYQSTLSNDFMNGNPHSNYFGSFDHIQNTIQNPNQINKANNYLELFKDINQSVSNNNSSFNNLFNLALSNPDFCNFYLNSDEINKAFQNILGANNWNVMNTHEDSRNIFNPNNFVNPNLIKTNLQTNYSNNNDFAQGSRNRFNSVEFNNNNNNNNNYLNTEFNSNYLPLTNSNVIDTQNNNDISRDNIPKKPIQQDNSHFSNSENINDKSKQNVIINAYNFNNNKISNTEEFVYLHNLQDMNRDPTKNQINNTQATYNSNNLIASNNSIFGNLSGSNTGNPLNSKSFKLNEPERSNILRANSESLFCFNDFPSPKSNINTNNNINNISDANYINQIKKNLNPNLSYFSQNKLNSSKVQSERKDQKIKKTNKTKSCSTKKSEANNAQINANENNKLESSNTTKSNNDNLVLVETYKYINDIPGESVILSKSIEYKNANKAKNKGFSSDKKMVASNAKAEKSENKICAAKNTNSQFYNKVRDQNPSFAGEFNSQVKRMEMLTNYQLQEAKALSANLAKSELPANNFIINDLNKNKNSENEFNDEINNNNNLNHNSICKTMEIFNDIKHSNTNTSANNYLLAENAQAKGLIKAANENSSIAVQDLIKKFSNNTYNKEAEQIVRSLNNFKDSEKYEILSKILSSNSANEKTGSENNTDSLGNRNNSNSGHKRILRKRSLSLTKNAKLAWVGQDKTAFAGKASFNRRMLKQKKMNIKRPQNSKANNNIDLIKKRENDHEYLGLKDKDKDKASDSQSSGYFDNEKDSQNEEKRSFNEPFGISKNLNKNKHKNSKILSSINEEENENEQRYFSQISDLSLEENLSESMLEFAKEIKSLLIDANEDAVILNKNVLSLYKLKTNTNMYKKNNNNLKEILNENDELVLESPKQGSYSDYLVLKKTKASHSKIPSKKQTSFLKHKRNLGGEASIKNQRYSLNCVNSASKFASNAKNKFSEKNTVVPASSEADGEYFYLQCNDKTSNNNNDLNNNDDNNSNNAFLYSSWIINGQPDLFKSNFIDKNNNNESPDFFKPPSSVPDWLNYSNKNLPDWLNYANSKKEASVYNNSQSGKKQQSKRTKLESNAKNSAYSNSPGGKSFYSNSNVHSKNLNNLKEELKPLNNQGINRDLNPSNNNINNIKHAKNSLNLHSFSKNDLEIIDKVNYPRRKKIKSEVNNCNNNDNNINNRKDSETAESNNKNMITTRTDLSNYAEIYPRELEEILKDERHVFMRNHFKNMYTLKNFYLYIKLNNDRRLKIKEYVVDLGKFVLERNTEESLVDQAASELKNKQKNTEEAEVNKAQGDIKFENNDDFNMLCDPEMKKNEDLNEPKNIIAVDKNFACEERCAELEVENLIKLNEEPATEVKQDLLLPINLKSEFKKDTQDNEYFEGTFINNQEISESKDQCDLMQIEAEADCLSNKGNKVDEKIEQMNKVNVSFEGAQGDKNLNSTHNSIKKIGQEIYKSQIDMESDSDNDKQSLSNSFLLNAVKMEIESESYPSKIRNIECDLKLEENSFSNLDNLNSEIPMDVAENTSEVNSNLIPLIAQNLKNTSNNNKENKNQNEEVHKLNIFDVAPNENINDKDYFTNETNKNDNAGNGQELAILNVNNYLSIKTQHNSNGDNNYFIEISKNIFIDEANNNADEDSKKKEKEDKVVEDIRPNYQTKKLWDPNLISNEKLEEYIKKSKGIWPEEYIWSEEIALNNLKLMDYEIEKALKKIKDNSDEIFKFIKEFCMTKSAYDAYGKNKYKRARTRLANYQIL